MTETQRETGKHEAGILGWRVAAPGGRWRDLSIQPSIQSSTQASTQSSLRASLANLSTGQLVN
jgi:hypothetical protein